MVRNLDVDRNLWIRVTAHVTFQPRLFDHKARDSLVDNLQHRSEQFGMGCEEDAKHETSEP